MAIDACRICGNHELLPVLDLGAQTLTCVFPTSPDADVPAVPLELVRCSPVGCGLLQLRHTADFSLMYGDHYAYRSGIRPFMIEHLRSKVDMLTGMVDIGSNDLVLDIGSNDATLLRCYPADGPQLVGVDPSAGKFRDRYPAGAELIADFFSAKAFTDRFGSRKAKAVTSIAMFYDLPRPLEFMQDVSDILADDGVWLMEQSYMPAMLEATAYDVVCHEHLEYYGLRQIEWMAERTGLTVISAELTEVYGGSLNVVLAKNPARHRVDLAGVERIRARESALALDTMAPFQAFTERVHRYREQLVELLADSRKAGRRTLGYGASTKGNVILQFCGLGPDELECIGEPSEEKWGCFTPGTGIPIVSEKEAKSRKPDQLLVLPWIYRDGFLEREREYMARGGRLVFPLPALEIV
ncbi:class I SAM-dependent methyltransferase [Streptomyces beigongshangae]|uniref:class I SAM-dependent methyltransferase n=1 Tax=Streptomyces beigongshangae TaxID=2841597 RepID=UPI001C842C7E|nr:class I SAM-dependent methyltransferase [Streptomyces sp. REN17]